MGNHDTIRAEATHHFTVLSAEEQQAIQEIVARATNFGTRVGIRIDAETLLLDLSSIHKKYCLNLHAFVDADHLTFIHDIFGIYGRVDWSTGDLPEFTPKLIHI